MNQNVAKRLRSMLHFSFLNTRSKFNPFDTLPPELIMAILAFLPSVDRICFSLSCKYTFCCFQTYIQGRGKTISNLFPRRKRPKLFANAAIQPRAKLLVRLQNDRWRYCNHCRTLHPHSAWKALRSNWKLYQQPCNSGCSLVGAQNRKCSLLYTGEVSICPCQAITFHQSQHIAEYCRGSSSELELFLDRSFEIFHCDDGRREILHKCSIATNAAQIVVTTRIKVCDRHNGLRIWNDFGFIVFRSSPSCSLLRYWCFPELLIERLIREAGSEFYCGVWGSYFAWRSHQSRPRLWGPFLLSIQLDRRVGRVKKWPSIRWKLQSNR
jgi:hypothetical protein